MKEPIHPILLPHLSAMHALTIYWLTKDYHMEMECPRSFHPTSYFFPYAKLLKL